MRDDFRHAPAEVAAQDAIDAAIERAARTQHALIMAEAQILAWKRRYAEAVRQAEAAEDRAEAAEAELVDRDAEEGVTDGQEGGGESAPAVGEAGPAGPVPA